MSKSYISPAKAIEITGIPKSRIYAAMKPGDGNRLSYEPTKKNKRKIELSELARWYEAETGDRLRLENDNREDSGQNETSEDVSMGIAKTSADKGGLEADYEVLKAKYDGLLLIKEQLEKQIELLTESLGEARNDKTVFSRLLTDQREDKSGQEKRDEALERIRMQNARLNRKVRELEEQSLWDKLFGKKQISVPAKRLEQKSN